MTTRTQHTLSRPILATAPDGTAVAFADNLISFCEQYALHMCDVYYALNSGASIAAPSLHSKGVTVRFCTAADKALVAQAQRSKLVSTCVGFAALAVLFVAVLVSALQGAGRMAASDRVQHGRVSVGCVSGACAGHELGAGHGAHFRRK